MVKRTEHLNGIQMYCEVHGQGEPLVLLHGFTGSGGDWEPFVNDLAAEYQLVIPDLRGHGGSTNPSNVFTFRQSALDVFALLDKLNVERFKAIGVSAGAKTLLHIATQQPDRVEALVLVSAAPYRSTITARTLIVHGDRDPFYPVNLAIEMYTAIPRSYLWIVPNGGHGPISGDVAKGFVETAAAFLRGNWGR